MEKADLKNKINTSTTPALLNEIQEDCNQLKELTETNLH